jgi:hypothetical protein
VDNATNSKAVKIVELRRRDFMVAAPFASIAVSVLRSPEANHLRANRHENLTGWHLYKPKTFKRVARSVFTHGRDKSTWKTEAKAKFYALLHTSIRRKHSTCRCGRLVKICSAGKRFEVYPPQTVIPTDGFSRIGGICGSLRNGVPLQADRRSLDYRLAEEASLRSG